MVTRPKHQADNFCELLSSKNIDSLRFPTMEIVNLNPHPVPNISDTSYDLIIFISANAVNFAHDLLIAGSLGSSYQIAAIGHKTKNALISAGYSVDLIGDKPFNSEAFLAHPSMQDIQKKQILIIKGKGGRNKLQRTLISRGAIVKNCEVYERKAASHAVKFINTICNDTQIDIIAITSFDSATHLFDFFKNCQTFKHTPLLVGSQRIANALADMNIANPLVVSENPSDECMLETLIYWIQNR